MYITKHANKRLLERYPDNLQAIDTKELTRKIENGQYIKSGGYKGRQKLMVNYKGKWLYLVYDFKGHAIVTFLKLKKKHRRFIERTITNSMKKGEHEKLL